MTNDQLIDQYRDALRTLWIAETRTDPWTAEPLSRVISAREALLAAMTKLTDTQPAKQVDYLMAIVDQYAYNYKGNFDGGARDRVEKALTEALAKP